MCLVLQSCQPLLQFACSPQKPHTQWFPSTCVSMPPTPHPHMCVQGPTNIADMEGSPFHELGLKDIMDGVRVWLHDSFAAPVRHQQ